MKEKNNTLVPVLLLYNVDSTWGLEEEVECMRHVELLSEALRKKGHAVQGVPVRRSVAHSLEGFDPKKYVVFNWCEGIDGSPNAYDVVARELDELGFIYTGAGPESLALTQNKGDVKHILDRQGISTPCGRVFTNSENADEWRVFPAIVKPAAEHGSYGIDRNSIVDDVAGLQRRIDYIMKEFGIGALVEEFIAGREINVAIWGNGVLETLPLYEVIFTHTTDPRRQLVDYDTKWSFDSIQYKQSIVSCPANVDEATAQHARSMALAAYTALGCRDYGRIDMRVRDGVSYVVDVNANPDITIEGGFANTVRAAGLDYGAMASRIVKLAAERKYHKN